MTSLPTTGLSLGRSDWPEFQPLWRDLQIATSQTRWIAASTALDFLERPSPKDALEFAVVWQTWSDEYPPDQILRLLAVLPLCRVVCVTGPWCEADQRTRRHWPAALPVPWWRAARRFQAELANFSDGRGPPWTAAREEVWLWEQSQQSHDRIFCQQDALQMDGGIFAGTMEDPLMRSECVVFDAEPWDKDRATALASQVQVSAPRSVWTYTGWPTADFLTEARNSGAGKVVAKGT